MMVRVNDKYVIDVDPQNYTAQIDTKKSDKEGNPVYKTIGYYGTLYAAIKGIAENETREQLVNGEISLADALTKVRSVYQEFEQLFTKIVVQK